MRVYMIILCVEGVIDSRLNNRLNLYRDNLATNLKRPQLKKSCSSILIFVQEQDVNEM